MAPRKLGRFPSHLHHIHRGARHPENIDRIREFAKSLKFAQVVWTVPQSKLTDLMHRCPECNVVRTIDDDGPFTKYSAILQTAKKDVKLLVLDDDMEYDKDAIKTMFKSCPARAICSNAFRVKVPDGVRFVPARQLGDQIPDTVEGFSGVLVGHEALEKLKERDIVSTFRSLTQDLSAIRFTDDIFISRAAQANDIPLEPFQATFSKLLQPLPSSQTGLCNENLKYRNHLVRTLFERPDVKARMENKPSFVPLEFDGLVEDLDFERKTFFDAKHGKTMICAPDGECIPIESSPEKISQDRV